MRPNSLMEWQSESDKMDQRHSKGTFKPFMAHMPKPPAIYRLFSNKLLRNGEEHAPFSQSTLSPYLGESMAQSRSGNQDRVYSRPNTNQKPSAQSKTHFRTNYRNIPARLSAMRLKMPDPSHNRDRIHHLLRLANHAAHNSQR